MFTVYLLIQLIIMVLLLLLIIKINRIINLIHVILVVPTYLLVVVDFLLVVAIHSEVVVLRHTRLPQINVKLHHLLLLASFVASKTIVQSTAILPKWFLLNFDQRVKRLQIQCFLILQSIYVSRSSSLNC